MLIVWGFFNILTSFYHFSCAIKEINACAAIAHANL